ncbi:CIC11C00000005573 [Sungouiella intermedia]|uniref:Sulfhydryl oxidase n=1 Tax=Sungouiella intermedia TaxID=45354 RepID=A0A1L0BZX4_9ASCO|nr:CIC11C00000005573 [[Candida] intermedia]
MKQTRRPVFSILVLFIVACAIYYVASGDSVSLGESVPMSTKKTTQSDNSAGTQADLVLNNQVAGNKKVAQSDESSQDVGDFTDTPFMPKMANETLKAQLGNSAWHLLHTVLARYPDKPTDQEKNTLKQYIFFFGQVYPCGDCARHFQKLLKAFPPQVNSRKTAALWGCHIHNQVNEKLKKPEYDCTTILEDYDCGCGDDEKANDFTLGNTSLEHLREVKVDEKGGKQGG